MVNVGDEVTVALPVWAEYTIRVKIVPEMLIEGTGEVDYDSVMDEAYEQLPSGLCHGCSTGNSGVGWRQPSPVNLELGDSPEGHYILGPDGKPVWGDPDKKVGW